MNIESQSYHHQVMRIPGPYPQNRAEKASMEMKRANLEREIPAAVRDMSPGKLQPPREGYSQDMPAVAVVEES